MIVEWFEISHGVVSFTLTCVMHYSWNLGTTFKENNIKEIDRRRDIDGEEVREIYLSIFIL